jgi:hypothetical protein
MKKEKIIPYSEIRDSLQTFDVVNCVYGTQWWNPFHWIMWLIGHTAMVYRCHETGQVMIYESTTMGRNDKNTGVQLRPMKEWLDSYPGKVYIRPTIIESKINRLIIEERCRIHIKKYRGTGYPNLKKWRWRWFVANAAIDLPFKTKLQNPDIDIVMFCTMLFVHCLRYCRLVQKEVNPAEFEPDDFRGGIEASREYLTEGVSMGEEYRIK